MGRGVIRRKWLYFECLRWDEIVFSFGGYKDLGKVLLLFRRAELKRIRFCGFVGG